VNTVFLPLYLLSLGVSSGLAGLYARRLLAAQGFAPTLETGLAVTAGVACAYAAAQLFYMAFLRLVKPWRGGGPLLAETLSLSAALVLLPYLAGLAIPWPYRILFKVEPFLYLGVFGAIHLFFKLATLFSATQAESAGRGGALGWAGASLVCAYGLFLSFSYWNDALGQARSVALTQEEAACAGTVHAMARRVPEGAAFRFGLAAPATQNVALRWAAVPGETEAPVAIYATVEFDGEAPKPQVLAVELNESGWAEMAIPAASVPANAAKCSVTWSGAKVPGWVLRTGLRPASVSSREMFVSGPWFHAPRDASKNPNLIVLVVEGLGSEHVSLLGYNRATTPVLDELGMAGSLFGNAFTPAPEAGAACMTLLTGVNPLVHGYLGEYQGPLPDGMQTLPEVLRQRGYVTAAFTEGLGPDGHDLFFGSGFERGFEVFDAAFPLEEPKGAGGGLPTTAQTPAGSEITLDKAAEWVEAHPADKFMLFVRLRELHTPMCLPRYGEGFLGRGRVPTPRDIYDTALVDVDRRIGTFFERVRAAAALENTCVVVTSPYGLDFSEPGRASWRQGGTPKRLLSESSLRVPVFLAAPGIPGRQHASLAGLDDVAPTLLRLLDAKFTHSVTGRNLFEPEPAREPVSMMGEPLALSLRIPRWRFTWQSGRAPFNDAVLSQDAALDMVNIERYLAALDQGDNLKREPMLAANLRERLRRFIETHSGNANAPKTQESTP
jgi:arylsulfatase A-like enzyme